MLAFAGIGDPDKFFITLEQAGIEAPVRRAFADHHRYAAGQAAALLSEADREGLLPLTTEKDAVKIAPADMKDEIIAIPAPMEIDPSDLERIESMIRS